MDTASDTRTVLTLDAGGTNFVFSAVRGDREVTTPVVLPSMGHDLDACLGQLRDGFDCVHRQTGRQAVALSFAFPGPADYPHGIIGDLGNLPAFRGGVALGPMLEEQFALPVYINNDGDLFTLGEARAGFLPWVNRQLEAAGRAKRYRNLLGVTLGTGFGAGIVLDGSLVLGDNSAAAEIWLVRNKLDPACFAEEGVSARAVKRTYARLAPADPAPDPLEIAAIAAGERSGDAAAASEAFRRLGEVAGDALGNALTLLDGLVVIGGGLSGAARWFFPALIGELNGSLEKLEGGSVGRLALRAFDLEDPAGLHAFLSSETRAIPIPGSRRSVQHDPVKRTGIGLSKLGASRAVALGAYAFALEAIDRTSR